MAQKAGISSVNIIAAGTVSEMIPPYANTKFGEKLLDVPEQVIKITFKPGTGPAASMPTTTEPTPFVVINREAGRRVGYPGKNIPGYSNTFDGHEDHNILYRAKTTNIPWCIRHHLDTIERVEISDAWPGFATCALGGSDTFLEKSSKRREHSEKKNGKSRPKTRYNRNY